jgi:hypothetical protein
VNTSIAKTEMVVLTKATKKQPTSNLSKLERHPDPQAGVSASTTSNEFPMVLDPLLEKVCRGNHKRECNQKTTEKQPKSNRKATKRQPKRNPLPVA